MSVSKRNRCCSPSFIFPGSVFYMLCHICRLEPKAFAVCTATHQGWSSWWHANRSRQHKNKGTVCALFYFVLLLSTVIYIDTGTRQSCLKFYFSRIYSIFCLLSLFPPPSQPPSLPLWYLSITDTSDGVDFVSFQVLPVSLFSLKVASRAQPAESGPRWPPFLRRPPARTDLRPLKPLARLWPFWAGAADVARRLWCRRETMKMISPRRHSKEARGWVRWLRANTHFLPPTAG